MLTRILSYLPKASSDELYQIIFAAMNETQQRLENVPKEQKKETSRGGNCFRSGKEYQHSISEILSSRTICGQPIIVEEVEGAKSGPDIVVQYQEQRIGWEVKNKGAFEGGSQKMTYRGDRLAFADDTLHQQLLGDEIIYDGKNLPYYEGKTTLDDYEPLKHIFDKEISKDVPSETMAKYYQRTGVHYLQIEGYGIYHTGVDPLHLEVPFFTCEQRLRIRSSKHKKKGVPTDIVGDINYNKKTVKKSPYDLNHVLPPVMQSPVMQSSVTQSVEE